MALTPAPLLSLKDAAQYLALSPKSLRTPAFRLRLGLPTVHLGRSRSVRFRLSDLEKIVAQGVERLPAGGGR
jgi:predicted DNA-binding transcriptional regulator AlpA